MSAPTYHDYKSTHIDWLEKIPCHWGLKPLKYCITRLGAGGTPETKEPEYWADEDDGDAVPWVSIGDMSNTEVVLHTQKRLTQKGLNSKGLEVFTAGSLLYSIYASLGKVATLGVDAAFNQAILAIEPNLQSTNQAFLSYWLKSLEAHLDYYSSSNTQANLNAAKVLSYPVALPSHEEQLAIASFLDSETAKIDALVAEQQNLVEIFKSKLSSLALSGYQDEKPNYQRIGRVTRVVSRPVSIKAEEEYESLGLFNRGRGIFHKEPRKGADMGDSDFFYVEAGDLILSGQFAWEGSVAVAGESESGCVVSHRYPIIQGDSENCLTEFLLAMLWTEHGNFLLNQCSRGAAGRNRPLNLGLLLKEEIALPSLAIQRAIQAEFRKYVELKTEQARQTELALERRSALISAAVTGQINVRGLATEEEP